MRQLFFQGISTSIASRRNQRLLAITASITSTSTYQLSSCVAMVRPISSQTPMVQSPSFSSTTKTVQIDNKMFQCKDSTSEHRIRTCTPFQRRTFKFVSPKAPVNLTPSSRQYFKKLLSLKTSSSPDIIGVMLKYQQSLSGEPRMVFTFEFVREKDLEEDDEGVSLEVLSDGTTPIPPNESRDDGLPKLYIHQHAFMKVLGATIDIEEDGFTPFLLDREGNVMDPNNS